MNETRRIEVSRAEWTDSRRTVIWKDVETGEEFNIYADDLAKFLAGTVLTVEARAMNSKSRSGRGLRYLKASK